MNAYIQTGNSFGFQRAKIGRKYFYLPIVIASVVLAYGLLTGRLIDSPLFPINTIQVVGEVKNIEKQTLQDAMQIYMQNGFFTLNVVALKQTVENLQWIESASVRRIWPDKVRVAITEQKAIARWGDQGLINSNGTVFNPGEENYPQNLVRFNGPDGMRLELLDLYQELQTMLLPYNLEIASMDINSRRALEMELHNGIKFVFGKQRDIGESAQLVNQFLIACEKGLAKKLDSIKLVDLRYTNGFSVQWKSENKSGIRSGLTGVSNRVAVHG